MSLYRYYCLRKPPMLGKIPPEGLLYVESFNCAQLFDGIVSWGYVEYSRRLNAWEIVDYELIESQHNPLLFK